VRGISLSLSLSLSLLILLQNLCPALILALLPSSLSLSQTHAPHVSRVYTRWERKEEQGCRGGGGRETCGVSEKDTDDGTVLGDAGESVDA
jgi:hypothetical protein